MSPVSLLKQDDDTDQVISDDNCEDHTESNISYDIDEDDSNHQQEVWLLCQVRQDRLSQPTRVPLRKTQSCADTVVACPPLPNSRNPAVAMTPALLKHQKSTLLNKLSDSHHTPWSKALPLHMSSADQNVPQPKTSAAQNVPQQQTATFEIAKRFREEIVFTKTPWLILSITSTRWLKKLGNSPLKLRTISGHLQVLL